MNARREYHQEWYQKNKEKRLAQMRERNLMVRYGVSLEQFDSMLESQHGGCAICGASNGYTLQSGKTKKLAVDHDHETGVVRGLLCDRCNLVIGKMDATMLRAAAEYLDHHAPV